MMRGFTFVEVLVTMLILAILVAGIFAISRVADMSFSTDMGLLDLQQQARAAMEAITREIREAQQASVSIVTPDRIDFVIINSSMVTRPIAYYLLNNQVIRQLQPPAGATNVVANDVNTLNFTLVTTRLLRVQLGLTKTVKQRPLTFSLTEEIRLRN